MSDDIVARLRNAKWTDDEVFGDAADEIERLRAELAARDELLREARPHVDYRAGGKTSLGGAPAIELLDRIDAALKGDDRD